MVSKIKGNAAEDDAQAVLQSLGCTVWVTAPNRGLCREFDDLVCWLPDVNPGPFWAGGRAADPNANHVEVKYGKSFPIGKVLNAHERNHVTLGTYAADPESAEYGEEAMLWSRAGIMTGSPRAWMSFAQGEDLDLWECDYKAASWLTDTIPRDGVLMARKPRKSWVCAWWVE
jgi:hypothetical protein